MSLDSIPSYTGGKLRCFDMASFSRDRIEITSSNSTSLRGISACSMKPEKIVMAVGGVSDKIISIAPRPDPQ